MPLHLITHILPAVRLYFVAAVGSILLFLAAHSVVALVAPDWLARPLERDPASLEQKAPQPREDRDRGPDDPKPAPTVLATQVASGQLVVAYLEPTNSALRPIYERLKTRRVLEQMREAFSPLSLPGDIHINARQCDSAASSYRFGGPVIICYETIAEIERLAPTDNRAVTILGPTIQLMVHEVALAIFDVLQIPVWGHKDDAADTFTTLFFLQFGNEVALNVLTGAARFFEASNRTWTGSDFSDVRATRTFRFYNYLCVAYGAAPQTFGPLVEQLGFASLPRSGRCAEEYKEAQQAFNQTVRPHINQETMRRVLAQNWLRPESMQR